MIFGTKPEQVAETNQVFLRYWLGLFAELRSRIDELDVSLRALGQKSGQK